MSDVGEFNLVHFIYLLNGIFTMYFFEILYTQSIVCSFVIYHLLEMFDFQTYRIYVNKE